MLPLYGRIQRNIYLSVAILLLSFAAASAAFLWQESKIDANKERASDFHLRTMLYAIGMKEAFSDLENQLREHSGKTDHQQRGNGRDGHNWQNHVQNSLYAISKDFSAIVALQETFNDHAYAQALDRINRDIGALERLSEGGAAPAGDPEQPDLLTVVAALILSVRQLERLHLAAYDQADRQIEAEVSRRNLVFVPLALAVLFCAVSALIYLTSQMRRALVQLQRTDRSLRESEERFRSVLDNLPSSVVLKDLEGRYLLVNKQFFNWYVPTDKPVLGRTAYDLFPKDRADRMSALDRQAMEVRGIVQEEQEVPHACGTVHTEAIVKFPIPGVDGEPVAVGAVSTDITASKRLEADLRQAQKMEAVGQLTGGVAHDFNNLLAVILGNAELLEDRAGKDARLVQAVIRAASRGAELTQRLLAFSRRQALRPNVLDLNATLAGMSDMLHRTLGETIEIKTIAAGDLWLTEVDPHQLENAILNLSLNARDAMLDGGKLTIETSNVQLDEAFSATHAEVAPGAYVMLAVSDTGCGMPPEVLDHVFEPFFTTKEVGKGSGLGLSMVYGFSKQSGGHVSVHSEEGQGTTVKIFLPQSIKSQCAPEPDHVEEDLPGHGEVVLVVEDDPDVRTSAVHLLEDLRYRVLAADDGVAAIDEMSRSPRIDLLLTDVVMPGGMNGIELGHQALQRHPGIKIVYMSGYAEHAVLDPGKLEEDMLLLQKPFRKTELARTLRVALDQAVAPAVVP